MKNLSNLIEIAIGISALLRSSVNFFSNLIEIEIGTWDCWGLM